MHGALWFSYVSSLTPLVVTRLFTGDDFLRVVFFVVPFSWLTFDLLLLFIERFKTLSSVIDGYSLCATLFTLKGRITLFSTSCSLGLSKEQDGLSGDNGMVVVFVRLDDLESEDELELCI